MLHLVWDNSYSWMRSKQVGFTFANFKADYDWSLCKFAA